MANKNIDQYQNLKTLERLVPGLNNVKEEATFKTTGQRLATPDDEQPLAPLLTREERVEKANKERITKEGFHKRDVVAEANKALADAARKEKMEKIRRELTN